MDYLISRPSRQLLRGTPHPSAHVVLVAALLNLLYTHWLRTPARETANAHHVEPLSDNAHLSITPTSDDLGELVEGSEAELTAM